MDQQAREQAFISALTTEQFVLQAWWFRRREQCAVGWRVALLLVLRSTRHLPASWRQRGLAMDWIWSWHLQEPTRGRTRVVQRNRMRLHPRWLERAFLATIVPAEFLMARSHLRGLQHWAQASTAEATTDRAQEALASPVP
jgi:hypothetical protein